MATRQEAIQQFEARLVPVIEKFVEEMSEIGTMEIYREQMGFVGEDLYRLMAKAAMAVWEASAEVQEFAETQRE